MTRDELEAMEWERKRVAIATYDDGATAALKATSEGHLEVAIHGPRLPFGSVDVAELYPVFQQDAVYGIPAAEVIQSSSSGTISGSNNLFSVSTNNTTAGSFASLQSRKRLRYRPGQGVVARYTALFSTPATNSYQVAGVGTAESGYYFGYNGTSFGILWVTGGVREIQTLTLSAGAGGAETVTVTLANTPTNVAVTAGSATAVAYTLSRATYPGWRAEQRGSTVVFVANSAGNQSGTFSVSSTGTTAGTFAETLAGALSTDTWIPQSEWNGDKLDGTGASVATLDPTKGNIYQIDIQYLGFGSVAFRVEIGADGNNSDFVLAHTIRFPNSRTTVNTSQPSFPFTMAVYNLGTASGTVSVKCGSFAGFIAGRRVLTGPRSSFVNSVTSSTSAFIPLVTVRNDRTFATRANQSVVTLLSASGAAKSTNGITTFYIVKNATLSAGAPSFTAQGTGSVLYYDTGSTAITFANTDLVWSGTVSETGQFNFAFTDEIEMQPGETLTLAVRSVSQTAVCVGQLNFREDQ